MAAKLTPKQQRFVDEYLVDLNATQAAIRAGYREKTAKAQGSRLLTKVDIATAIQKRREELQQNANVTVERIIQEYARIAFLDPANIFGPDGRSLTLQDMDEDTRRAIAGLDISTIGGGDSVEIVKKIKLADKKGALDSLAKHLGMFVDRHEVTGKDGAPLGVVVVPAKETGG